MKFSIGEMSKLHRISIQTLRYYDEIGLLKPASINEDTNYRYYTIDQFIILDLIRQCKVMGLSLKQIKALMEQTITPEVLLGILSQQEAALDKKIMAMACTRSHISTLRARIQESLSVPLNEIFIKEEDERAYKCYHYVSSTNEEIEINLRKVLAGRQEECSLLSMELVFTADLEAMKESKRIYKNIMVGIMKEDEVADDLYIVPKGQYLTLYYDDNYGDNSQYYEKLIDYAKAHHLQLIGDFYDITIIPKIDDEGREKSLVQLQIAFEKVSNFS